MKKLLLLIVVLVGGAMFLTGKVAITPDNRVHVASLTVPIPATIQQSPFMGLINVLLPRRQETTQQASAPVRQDSGTAPAPPIVTRAGSAYDVYRPGTGEPRSADLINAASRSLRGPR